VSQLAEIQRLFRDGILIGETSHLAGLFHGSRYPERRFAIHQRHYETSLVTALMTKFAATHWLVGTPLMTKAATRYVHACPPQTPCIAEYGRDFPQFVSDCPGAERLFYLRDFAELEWHVGQISVAVEERPVSRDEFMNLSADAVPDIILTLQQGVRYLQVAWPVDELLMLYLDGSAPEHFPMDALHTGLEVRGARGEFHISRLGTAEFIFCKSVLEGRPIGDAAEAALDLDAAFDPGEALARVISSGLVTAIARGREGRQP